MLCLRARRPGVFVPPHHGRSSKHPDPPPPINSVTCQPPERELGAAREAGKGEEGDGMVLEKWK